MNIYPSLIASDLLHLKNTITTLEPFCSGFHIDIMDFHFVPNLTWGPQFVQALRSATNKPLWIHLMVDNPVPYIPLLQASSHDLVTVHVEQKNYREALHELKSKKIKAGIAYNPSTPIIKDPELYKNLHHILLMSVEPGFSWQEFKPEVLEKIKELVTFKRQHNLNFLILLDGGIKESNLALIKNAGADGVAIGSGIFGAPDPVHQLQNLT